MNCTIVERNTSPWSLQEAHLIKELRVFVVVGGLNPVFPLVVECAPISTSVARKIKIKRISMTRHKLVKEFFLSLGVSRLGFN